MTDEQLADKMLDMFDDSNRSVRQSMMYAMQLVREHDAKHRPAETEKPRRVLEVLLVDPVLVTVRMGDRAPFADIFLDIDNIEDNNNDFFSFGLHGTILSLAIQLGIPSLGFLCHAVLPTRGHVSRLCPAGELVRLVVNGGPAPTGPPFFVESAP